MKLNNQHKALLLTLLIMGTVVLSVFSLSLKKQQEQIAESYYLLEPEKVPTEEELETLEKLNNTKAETNQAFNETQKSKHFAQAYKTIAPPEDFVPQSRGDINNEEALNSIRKKYKDTNAKKLKKEDLSSFKKVNDLLKKQQSTGNNSKSTMSYSLVNRTLYGYETPVYLCEQGGKIVINITVNSNGSVIDAYVNSASTSSNECLTNHALEYAKQSRFSSDASKKTQLGSITFNFIGKR